MISVCVMNFCRQRSIRFCTLLMSCHDTLGSSCFTPPPSPTPVPMVASFAVGAAAAGAADAATDCEGAAKASGSRRSAPSTATGSVILATTRRVANRVRCYASYLSDKDRRCSCLSKGERLTLRYNSVYCTGGCSPPSDTFWERGKKSFSYPLRYSLLSKQALRVRSSLPRRAREARTEDRNRNKASGFTTNSRFCVASFFFLCVQLWRSL